MCWRLASSLALLTGTADACLPALSDSGSLCGACMLVRILHPLTCLNLPPQERSIVSDMSGTTRDAIDTDVTLKDGRK